MPSDVFDVNFDLKHNCNLEKEKISLRHSIERKYLFISAHGTQRL